jgi:hypothetical protein
MPTSAPVSPAFNQKCSADDQRIILSAGRFQIIPPAQQFGGLPVPLKQPAKIP